jgi:hypothetical protein
MLRPETVDLLFTDCLNTIKESLNGKTQIHSHELCLADQHIRLNFVGSSLVPFILPAISHLCQHIETKPDFEIYLLDLQSTDIPMMDCPWDWEKKGNEYIACSDNRFTLVYQPDISLLHLIDFQRKESICWFREKENIPYYERAAPLRFIFDRWLSRAGHHLVHGAALAIGDKAVLLAGKGGMGKSSSAMACLTFDQDLSYLSDDFCLYSPQPTHTVHCLYNSIKLCEDMMHHFSHLPSGFFTPDYPQPKNLIFIKDHYPDRVCRSAKVKALLLPRISEVSKTEVVPATPTEALLALAPSSLFTLSKKGPTTFESFAQLVRKIPAFWLEISRDLSSIPVAIRKVIEDSP